MVSAVDQLTAGIDTLLDTDAAYDSLGRDELLDVVRRVETQRRRFAALDQVLLAGLDARGVATEVGLRNTAGLLRAMLRLSPAEASTRVRAAKACGPRRALDGQPVPPLRPVIAAAQREGTVSVEQAALITRVLAGLPAAVPAEVIDRVETTLVEHAHTFDPHALSVIAGRITDTLDPDGSLTDDAEHQRQRQFSLR